MSTYVVSHFNDSRIQKGHLQALGQRESKRVHKLYQRAQVIEILEKDWKAASEMLTVNGTQYYPFGLYLSTDPLSSFRVTMLS